LNFSKRSFFALQAFFLLLLASCTRLPQGNPPSQTSSSAADQSLEAAVAPLRKSTNLATYRGALQQLNAEMNRSPGGKIPLLTEVDQRFLREQFRLDEQELNEVASTSFTLLDAHHLDQCFLLHDAARALQLGGRPDDQRAAAAFAWVMRQVRLADEGDEPGPPAAVLRRGWGSDIERSFVFLALLDQLEIPGCMLAAADGKGQRLWIPGALVNNDILLFDTRLGVPVPGPAGQGIATLAQARTRSEVLGQLASYQYGVTANQLQQATVLMACPLSALSPRMWQLEKLLATSNPARLNQNPQTLVQKFRPAVQGPALAGVKLEFWQPGQVRSPTQALRAFLPPEQGGSDLSRERQLRFNGTMIPWQRLPAQIEKIPDQIELGSRLRALFAKGFLDFFIDTNKPRELMVHGRFDDAVKGLVETRDQSQQLQAMLRDEPGLEQAFDKWCQEAVDAQGDVLRLGSTLTAAKKKAEQEKTAEAQTAMETAQAALHKAETRMKTVWNEGEKPLRFVVGSAAGPLNAEATYYLALAKHEQAEQVGGAPTDKTSHVAWQSAAEWWQRYLQENPGGTAETAARLGRFRALEALGQHDAARAVLESASKLQGWDQRAVRYRLDKFKPH
jgi:hypothetical protein